MRRYVTTILIAIMMLPLIKIRASEGPHYVIVSGQVINYEYGNPVKNHSVFIVSVDNSNIPNRETIELKTNEEGFYFDSIPSTQLKGAYTIYTFDHYGRRIDTTLHFRFSVFFSNVLVANFRIYMPHQIELLQTRFNYYQKNEGDRFTFLFIDLTHNEHIVSRHWDFGDGTISTEKKVVHRFTASGFHKITLIVHAMINSNLQTSTFSRMIYLSDRAYYNFGGHAFCKYFPIDFGVAFLYMIDSSKTFIPVDTAYIDTLGYYYFYQVPKASYLVKAQPTIESLAYGKMLPTYYGDELLWENAKTIHLTQTGWEYDIHLQTAEGIYSGNGFIHGNISFFNGLKEGTEWPAEGIPVYLLDSNHASLVYRYSDSLGDFNFDQIAYGDYTLMPEITGVHCDGVTIEISYIQPSVDSVRILIDEGVASLLVPEQRQYWQNLMIGTPYPLPTISSVKVAIQSRNAGNLKWNVFDITGHLINKGDYSLQAGNNLFTLTTSKLKSGLYFVRFLSKNGEVVQKKFLVGE